MSPNQFQQMMDRFADFEKRMRRIEYMVSVGVGMLMIGAFFIANDLIILRG